MDERHHVATYHSYGGAQRAIDALAESRFSVIGLAIVASDVRLVETVTGRRTLSSAAASGAGTGAIIGAVLGWFFGAFSWIDPIITGLALALYGGLLGAILGGAIGVAGHALLRERRNFSSIGTMEAGAYEVVAADAELARSARAELVRVSALRDEVGAGERARMTLP